MEEALTTRLLAAPTMTALVAARINWGERVRREALPALTMMIVSPGRNYVHSGPDPTGNPRVQFDCYGKTAAQALAVAHALRDVLETAATVGSIAFSRSILEAERGPLVEDTGGGLKAYKHSVDYFVWFSPAA